MPGEYRQGSEDRRRWRQSQPSKLVRERERERDHRTTQTPSYARRILFPRKKDPKRGYKALYSHSIETKKGGGKGQRRALTKESREPTSLCSDGYLMGLDACVGKKSIVGKLTRPISSANALSSPSARNLPTFTPVPLSASATSSNAASIPCTNTHPLSSTRKGGEKNERENESTRVRLSD